MESPRFTIWPDAEILEKRVDFLSLASVSEMRQIPSIPFPNDEHSKAVEFAMIVRSEFTKRLKRELATLSATEDSTVIRARLYKVLDTLRDEIALMADSGSGWLERKLEHTFKDIHGPNVVHDWADRYLRSMLVSIGV